MRIKLAQLYLFKLEQSKNWNNFSSTLISEEEYLLKSSEIKARFQIDLSAAEDMASSSLSSAPYSDSVGVTFKLEDVIHFFHLFAADEPIPSLPHPAIPIFSDPVEQQYWAIVKNFIVFRLNGESRFLIKTKVIEKISETTQTPDFLTTFTGGDSNIGKWLIIFSIIGASCYTPHFSPSFQDKISDKFPEFINHIDFLTTGKTFSLESVFQLKTTFDSPMFNVLKGAMNETSRQTLWEGLAVKYEIWASLDFLIPNASVGALHTATNLSQYLQPHIQRFARVSLLKVAELTI